MNIRDYWIEELQNTEEFRAIAQLEDIEMSELRQNLSDIIDDQFIETAKETGIARREKLLKIQPYADDTLKSRRFRIKTKWNDRLPYSCRQLENKLDDLVGSDGYTISLDHGAYTLSVRISLGVKRMLNDARNMIDNMAPCNLSVTVDLLYNKYGDLSYYDYKQLSQKTYTHLREEVLY